MPKAKTPQIGKLPPRYSFILNPHKDLRCSTCPKCKRKTSVRKFALLVAVKRADPVVIGKTCKFCATCELIICHQDELEPLLAATFGPVKPSVLGNEYFVVGTVERASYRKGLKGEVTAGEVLGHLAEFKKHLELGYRPAGWYPNE
jgi:hypothetical protein